LTQKESDKTFLRVMEILAKIELNESPLADFAIENDSENYKHYEIYEVSPSFQDLNPSNKRIVKVILLKESN
jgi:hypothetical protein